jgi:hypothetical protein
VRIPPNAEHLPGKMQDDGQFDPTQGMVEATEVELNPYPS